MLHEILISLSGYPSPLLDLPALKHHRDGSRSQGELLLSVGEQQMLAALGTLSRYHKTLRERSDKIAESHPSIICRAVANAIRQTQLRRYQNKILDVEERILTQDASLVGAYNIVPLATIIEQFDEWRPRLKYLLEITDYIGDPERQHACSGAVLINKLRTDSHTGHTDLEAIALELSSVAERAWLQQLSAWLLYGSISSYASHDFFVVEKQGTDDGKTVSVKRQELLPNFVDSATSNSIHSIGQTLARIKTGQLSEPGVSETVTEQHALLITSLALPIQEQQFRTAISHMKTSVSKNVLQHLLPSDLTSLAISSLQQFFLLQDQDFALHLLEEAERVTEARWKDTNRIQHRDPLKALQALSLKESEVGQILESALRRVSMMHDDTKYDDLTTFARKHISLSTSRPANSRSSASGDHGATTSHALSTAFNDLFLPEASSLWMTVQSPLDLILSTHDIERYSQINAYLLSIHRAKRRLCGLWSLSYARRSKAQPRRQEVEDRKIWAACSAALLFLSQLAVYLHEEVITPTCEHFVHWALRLDSTAERHAEGSSTIGPYSISQRDPEALAGGHRRTIDNIVFGSLIADLVYTKALRALMGSIDQVVALFTRVLEQRRWKPQDGNISTGEDSGIPKELQRTQAELSRACARQSAHLQEVVARLQELSQDRSAASEAMGARQGDIDFRSCRIGTIDHLLSKLRLEVIGDDTSDDE